MNVIVTGIPRAGTTLTAALLDALPNSVCLNEPAWHNAKAAPHAEGFVQFIAQDFVRLRAMLLAKTPVPDRRGANGEAITNYFSRANDGAMKSEFVDYPLVRSGLRSDFTLAIKHNGPYLAVLPELIASKQFKILAVIREPLAVISSWRRLQLPISRGDMPNAKPYWRELRMLIDTPMPLLEKQVRMYDLMRDRIHQHEADMTVIRYEELIQKPQWVAEAMGAKTVVPELIKPAIVEEDPELVEAIRAFSRY